MTTPVVSVLIPARDAETTIGATLESIRRQTLHNIEVVVIDDGSTDGTMRLVEELGDPRFRGYSYPNAGLATARNRGLEKARGEFVTFIDADDLWTPDKLADQVSAMRSDAAAGGAYSWTVFLDETGRYLFAKEPSYLQGRVREELLEGFFIANGSNVILRRMCIEEVGAFDPTYDPCSDWEYMVRFSGRWPLLVVPRYQVFYRLSAGSMTSRIAEVERANRRLWQAAYDSGIHRSRGAGRSSLAGILQYECFLHLSRDPVNECRQRAGRKLWSSIRTYPPILLRLKTLKLVGAWVCMRAMPASRARAALRGLLRLHGRWSALRQPDLKRAIQGMGAW